jgi:hypothetical protein
VDGSLPGFYASHEIFTLRHFAGIVFQFSFRSLWR